MTALILAIGAGTSAAALLCTAIAVRRLRARVRRVEQRLASLAQINADLRAVNTVPDALTPELAARIDDPWAGLPCRTPDQDSDMPRPAELERRADPITAIDWDDVIAHLLEAPNDPR